MAAAPNRSGQLQNEALNRPRPTLGFLVLARTKRLYSIGEWLTGFGCSEDGYRSKSRLLLHLRQNLGEIEMKGGLFLEMSSVQILPPPMMVQHWLVIALLLANPGLATLRSGIGR